MTRRREFSPATKRAADAGKITFEPQFGGDGYVVSLDGDRLGFVRQVARQHWAATDTYFVAAGNHHKTRKAAVKALLRRKAKNEGQP